MSSTSEPENVFLVKEVNYDELLQVKGKNVSREGPERIDYFSWDPIDSSCTRDKSALRYLEIPNPVSINFLEGYNPNLKYGHVSSQDEFLLRRILNNEKIEKEIQPDFICKNGVMKDFMMIEKANFDWHLSAIKIKGRIVLNRFESTDKKERIDNQTEWNNKSTYASLKLQRLITKNSNGIDSDLNEVNESFWGVFHSKIGSHRIVHINWLSCVEGKGELDKPFEDMEYVLIRKINAPRVSHNLRNSCTWWALATLSGIDTIVCAKFDENYTVTCIDKIQVKTLITRVKEIYLITTLTNILDEIKLIVKEENISYNFSFKANDKKLLVYKTIDSNENKIP